MALIKEKKDKIIQTYKVHKTDTGSAPVQVALLTERINSLTGHFKLHKKDHHSRLGLLRLVSQRRKLLEFIRRTSLKTYQELLEKLDLRK